VLDYDTLGGQLGRETLGPSSEERLAGGVDGEHWGRRCACKRAHVQDQALFTGRCGNDVSACAVLTP
jgi:hypothetical protein